MADGGTRLTRPRGGSISARISAGVRDRNSPGLSPRELRGPMRHAPQLRHRVPHRLQQPPHLVVLALVQRELQPGVVLGLQHAHAVDRQPIALDAHAPAQPLQRLRVRHAVHLGVVDARHLVARVRDALGEGAVVGQEQQALGGHVEAAHRERGRPPSAPAPSPWAAAPGSCRVLTYALRLVEQEVHGRGGRLHAHAVHADVVAGDVGLGAQLASPSGR